MKQVFVAWLLLLCVSGAAGVLDADCSVTSDCSDANQVCDNLKCKIKAEGGCTHGTDNEHCVTDSACTGTVDTTAGTCDCSGTYVVDAGFCKVDVAGSCAAGESTKCKTGTVCDSSDSNVCNLDVGQSCASNANDCKTGTVCDTADSNVCNLDVGQSCASHTNDCKTGTVCDTTAGNICNLDVGESCASNPNGCKTGTVCDTGDSNVCNIKAEGACTDGTNSQHCVTDSTCSGTNNGGGTCDCTGTYVADAGFCKVDVAGSCAGGDSTKCKTGTVCDAADSVCKKKVEESCTKDDDCAGSNVACTGLICTCTAGSANSDKTDCSGVAGLAGSIFLLIAALVTSRFL